MPVEKKCVVCSKVFFVPPVRAATAITCSRKCRGEYAKQQYAAARTQLKCVGCGGLFTRPPCHEKRARFCSVACANQHKPYRGGKGMTHYHWGGGSSAHSDGYLYRSAPRHPFGNKSGCYVFEHRIVMEEWMAQEEPRHQFLMEIDGKLYLRNEIQVHHINGTKRDNRRANLLACTSGAHQNIHNGTAPMQGEVWPEIEGLRPYEPRKVDRTCEKCGTIFVAKISDVKRGGARFCSRLCYDLRVRTPFDPSR